ncbi:uncharacterized protein LOC132758374 isoform X2 [Ruditapes philippinarum]|uniref:uncharacterized protein LOC132758374 isoform X2 n=1 Tax=Ruditapes philippinarum TaxID=129788 RepID=UPI00295B1E99|nr:uncharacterized protein LOC132758374 isoform X2 [Ruditapes philippinarum]
MTFWNIFILFSVFHECAESYLVSNISSQWANIYNKCSIAVPPIRQTSTGIVVDANISLSDTEHAWVGYIKTQKSFDYIGCFQQKSLGILQSEKVEVVSPGQCFDVCHNRSTVGVSGNECFCLNDSSSLSALRSNYTICTTECESKSGVVCGYRMENGSKYISIYKEHKLEAKDISARNYVDAHCLRLDRDQNTFAWDKCSEKMLVVCDFGPTCIPTSSNGLNMSWIRNTNECFSNGGLPLRVKNCSAYNDRMSQAWTSFIRSYVIISLMQSSDIFDSGIIQYGYVQKQDEKIVLNFTKNGTILNKILCTKKPSPKEVNETPEFGMFMYTVVSAAAVLVTVMVAISIALICRRKKRRHKNLRRNSSHYDNPVISFTANDENIRRSRAYETIGQNRANQYDEAYQHVNENHMQICPDNVKQEEKSQIQLVCGQDKHEGNNSEYERIDDFISKPGLEQNDNNPSKIKTAHDYYVLEKPLEIVTPSNHDISRDTDKTSKESEFNIYNKLVIDSKQTYDHVFLAKPSKQTAFDNAYNTTAFVRIATDS